MSKTCPDCMGTGNMPKPFSRAVCRTCHGTGTVEPHNPAHEHYADDGVVGVRRGPTPNDIIQPAPDSPGTQDNVHVDSTHRKGG